MADFVPETPVPLQIRKIIFDMHNDVDKKFTNDEIFDVLKRNGDLDPEWIVDDIEPYITGLCDSGMARNIAQNFTTVWLKLFDAVERHRCGACGLDVFLGRLEERACPNPSCGAEL